MGLKEQMAADAGVFINSGDFAESVTYYVKDGDALQIDILCNEGLTSTGVGSAIIETEAMVLMKKEDIASPSGGDRIETADGVVWSIDKNSLRDSDGNFWRVRVTRGGTLTLRDGY